ncbi:MAG: hypothetical protein ACXVZW_10385 [Gaiellaceae bacterium]
MTSVLSARFLRVAPVAACAAAIFCAATGAAGAPPELLKAVQKTNSAQSASITLTERIGQGSQVVLLRLHGVEQPRAKSGSFVLDISPAQPGLGEATEILIGSKLYIHYPILDTLHAKNPKVKSWIVVDTTSSLGINPSSLTALEGRQLQGLTGVKVVGTSAQGGVPVTRYAGTLDLHKAAQSGPMQQLLSHLPPAAATVLKGTARIELWAGSDGYLHRSITTLSLPVQGDKPLRLTIDGTLDNFDKSSAPIAPPPAGDVMTLAEFGQLTGSATAAPAPADTALLQKVVLKPAQVGGGYKLSQMAGGHEVQNEVTLDFCDATYPSESLRTARLQVLYDARGSSYHASNEVVTYQPGGAKQALAEVTHEAAACPNGAVKDPPAGVSSLTRHTKVVTDSRLLPGAIAILETDTGVVKGKTMTTFTMAVYQIRGNVLSGVYGFGASAGSVQAHTLHAAEQSALNLTSYD